MRFTKMHGLGNDYIYVNGFEQTVDDPSLLAPAICNRHRGVGADGLILILPPDAGSDAHVRMRMFNADGTEAEMCGNGIRCVAKFAHDHGLSTAKPMRVQTHCGILALDYSLNGNGTVHTVTVDMGEPILEPQRIPVRLGDMQRVVNHSIKTLFRFPPPVPPDWTRRCGLDERMTCVSMGNPHAVLYCDQVEAVPLESVGSVIENHPAFPNRINVHFVQVHEPGKVTMRTWERGSGVTQACGTGASAVCVAGVLTGRTEPSLQAHLPGGDLALEWRQSNNHVYMTGPAVEVFRGQWP